MKWILFNNSRDEVELKTTPCQTYIDSIHYLWTWDHSWLRLSSSPNILRASYINDRSLKHEAIVKNILLKIRRNSQTRSLVLSWKKCRFCKIITLYKFNILYRLQISHFIYQWRISWQKNQTKDLIAKRCVNPSFKKSYFLGNFLSDPLR